jgi:hypothetical protein
VSVENKPIECNGSKVDRSVDFLHNVIDRIVVIDSRQCTMKRLMAFVYEWDTRIFDRLFDFAYHCEQRPLPHAVWLCVKINCNAVVVEIASKHIICEYFGSPLELAKDLYNRFLFALTVTTEICRNTYFC